MAPLIIPSRPYGGRSLNTSSLHDPRRAGGRALTFHRAQIVARTLRTTTKTAFAMRLISGFILSLHLIVSSIYSYQFVGLNDGQSSSTNHDLAPCSMINPSTNEIIDLNRLSQSTGLDYMAIDEESGDVFKINVCRAVMAEIWNVPSPGLVGIYRSRPNQKDDSLGEFNTTLRPHGNSASIVYRNGSPCPSNPQVRMGSVISFECADDVWHAGSPVFAGSADGCQFFFTWRTSFACGSLVQRSLRHSLQVMAMALLMIFGVYYILFFFYRRCYLHMRGQDQFPSTPMTSITPQISILISKLKDGFLNAFGYSSQYRTWSPTTARAWWEQNSYQHSRPTPQEAGNYEFNNNNNNIKFDTSFEPVELEHAHQTYQSLNKTSNQFPTASSNPPAVIPIITRTDVYNQITTA
ncbi:hypothetical protein O181_028561 [Austropuccinia psidii MF-1]|uniref:MRH domain-containing protein n=1 Tax=Austropuccinia psidii MF-1 TaxID=1389203 RepID=A0A9Q3H2H6_9BASI|nr:hypothetical protein [Austropuccinia psidii MF-1]